MSERKERGIENLINGDRAQAGWMVDYESVILRCEWLKDTVGQTQVAVTKLTPRPDRQHEDHAQHESSIKVRGHNALVVVALTYRGINGHGCYGEGVVHVDDLDVHVCSTCYACLQGQ